MNLLCKIFGREPPKKKTELEEFEELLDKDLFVVEVRIVQSNDSAYQQRNTYFRNLIAQAEKRGPSK